MTIVVFYYKIIILKSWCLVLLCPPFLPSKLSFTELKVVEIILRV